MSNIRLSPMAKADLSAIWDYTQAKWGAQQAEIYTLELWQAIKNETTALSNSVDCSDIRKGYKKAIYGAHIIFFKPTADGIDVIRILHQRMNSPQHLCKEQID